MLEELLVNSGQSGAMAYPILFGALLGGAFGLPIPEDLPLLAAGVLAQQGAVRLEIVFLVCYVAVLIGDLIIYGAGYYFGPALLNHRWICNSLNEVRVERIRLSLEKRSVLAIFLARHLFYLRTVTFLACGMVRMSPVKFIIADAIAALISAPIMIGLGYLFAEHLDVILVAIEKGQIFLMVAAIPAGIWGYSVWSRRRKRRALAQVVCDHAPESSDEERARNSETATTLNSRQEVPIIKESGKPKLKPQMAGFEKLKDSDELLRSANESLIQ